MTYEDYREEFIDDIKELYWDIHPMDDGNFDEIGHEMYEEYLSDYTSEDD